VIEEQASLANFYPPSPHDIVVSTYGIS